MSPHWFFHLRMSVLALLLCCTGALAQGNPDQGKALFTGSTAFAKGGAPCLACHSLTGLGLDTGANYGPDLSSLYQGYGAEGLSALLGALEFPSMEAIYSARPLSEEEQADVIAFLEKTAQLSVTPGNGQLALQVMIGVAVLMGLTLLAGLRRMKSARRPLIDRQRKLIHKGEMK